MSAERADHALWLQAPGASAAELLYVEEPLRVYVVPSTGAPGWSSAALRAGRARIWRGGGPPTGPGELCSAGLLTDPARSESVRELFRQKYGAPTWERFLSLHTKIMVLGPSVRPAAPKLRELVRQEFDAVAATYAASLEHNPWERHLKRAALQRLREILRDSDPLLEIGAGTGVETIPMLRAGHRVTAIDISPLMRDELERRINSESLGSRAKVLPGGLASLAEDLPGLPDGAFGGAWSTFGAPNLEPEVPAVARGLARLVRPGAPVVLGMLNRWAVAPLLYEVGLGDWRAIRARRRQPIPAEQMRYPLDVYAWTPREYARLCAPYFTLAGFAPVSALSPPYSSPRLIRSFRPAAWELARKLDSWLTPKVPALSEWVLIELRRTGIPAPGRAPSPSADGAARWSGPQTI